MKEVPAADKADSPKFVPSFPAYHQLYDQLASSAKSTLPFSLLIPPSSRTPLAKPSPATLSPVKPSPHNTLTVSQPSKFVSGQSLPAEARKTSPSQHTIAPSSPKSKLNILSSLNLTSPKFPQTTLNGYSSLLPTQSSRKLPQTESSPKLYQITQTISKLFQPTQTTPQYPQTKQTTFFEVPQMSRPQRKSKQHGNKPKVKNKKSKTKATSSRTIDYDSVYEDPM